MKPSSKHALIICAPDAYANAVKPNKLLKYCTDHGYTADLFSTTKLSRAGTDGLAAVLPGRSPRQWLLYALEAVNFLSEHAAPAIKQLVKSLVMLPITRLRGKILAGQLPKRHYDLLICENNLDIGFLENARIATIQIIDLPAPFAEELYFGGQLSESAFHKYKTYEAQLYAKADHLSFHWHTYTNYVRQHKYNGQNFINLSYGTDPKAIRSHFSKQPRIIFLGFLGGYWVNLPLLKRLCDRYPNIDVYGGPAQSELGGHYKGYAPSIDIIADYQFGLITLSDDPLRQSSFSSKQLEYYAYGLPVLTPEWRKDAILDPAALRYNEETFEQLLAQYSDETSWKHASNTALSIAASCNWDEAFRPLETII